MFSITVPADSLDQALTWTLVAHGQTSSIPLKLDPQWKIEPLVNSAMGNTPPIVTFEPGGEPSQGPPLRVAASLSTVVGTPLSLCMWVTDDMYTRPGRRPTTETPLLRVFWSKYRGPGTAAAVTFETPEPEVSESDGETLATASFAEAGQYVLRAEVVDTSGRGGGGSQCCWTTVHVEVDVSDTP